MAVHNPEVDVRLHGSSVAVFTSRWQAQPQPQGWGRWAGYSTFPHWEIE